MGSSQGSTLTPATADVDIRLVDLMPVYIKELIAGGAAGAFSKTAVAPLERLKILLQTRTEEFKSLGILRSLKRLKQHEGVLGFYKGNGASVLRIVPYAALHYMTYEQYRCWIINNCSSMGTGPVVDLLAGSAAGGTAVLCTYPLDLARTKLAYQVSSTVIEQQSDHPHGSRRPLLPPPHRPSYTGIKDVFSSVYKEGGLRSLYRGVGPTMIGILPYAGLKFYIYEELKTRVPEDYRKSVVLGFSCGALAGLFGQTLTYPLDVVRRQMQVQSQQQQLDGADRPRIITGTMQGISTIIRENGWRRLFAGLSLNYLKVVPSVAIGFAAYDTMKSFLGVPPRGGPQFFQSKRILSDTLKMLLFQPPAVRELYDHTTGAAVPPLQQTYYERPKNVAFSPYHHFHHLVDPPVGLVFAPSPSHSKVAIPPERQRNHGVPYYSKGPTSSAAAKTFSSINGKPWSSSAQPFLAIPPPPPNVGCMLLTCANPLTYSPPGSPCACVLPIRVGLQLDVAPYTFFPLVSQLSQEIASGVFMDQNQVRVMGANVANEEPDKTVIFINVVPYGIQFDSFTAFWIYEMFWNKKIFIKDPIFRDYDVLYVIYPGLPPSPPMASGNFGSNSNERTFIPLAVDVRETKEKNHQDLKILVILSSATALVLFVGAALFLLLKCSYQNATASVLRSSLSSYGSGSTLPKMKSFSDSSTLNSSIIPYVGLAKTFSIAEIEKATNKFAASSVIGEGGFGRVYEATLADGTSAAVKVLKRYDHHGNREFLAEIEMLSRLHHRNLVKLIGICAEDYIQCLVYELVPNGSVEFHLHGDPRNSNLLDWNSRMKIALGAARCLAYLHEDSNPCVIHRDFKSSNVLLEHDFTPRVSDLGLARTALNGGNEHISTNVVGTFGYVAPEYAMTGHLLVKSDVYSYGVVLLELLTGRKPVDVMRPSGQENLVTWARPHLTSKEGLLTILDPSCLGANVPFNSITKVAAIAAMCVEAEFSQRPPMGEVVQALKLVYHECDDHARLSFQKEVPVQHSAAEEL